MTGGPDDGPAAGLPAVLRRINAAHGTAFRLTGRYAHGEQGAFRLRDAAGGRYVLKWAPEAAGLGPLSRVVAALDRLRPTGYPVPRCVAVGTPGAAGDPDAGPYAVLEALPGTPLGRVDEAALRRLLALNDLQAGLSHLAADPGHTPAGPPAPTRPLLEPMRAHAPATAALLVTLQDLVAAHGAHRVPADDLVHFDFSGPDILAAGDDVTGVVDWEGLQPGDRTFDLATLLFWCYGHGSPAARDRLWATASERVGPPAVGVYLAHTVHRQVEWSVRHHDRRVVDGWLRLAAGVLEDVGSRTGCRPRPWS